MTAVRSRSGVLPLEALVFAVGFSSLGAEIAAARLMAPFFGSSTVIWANTIAVVLLALSAGYKLGGVLADRRPRRAALSALVLAGAALLAIVPFIAHPFLSLSVSAFDTLSVGAFAASLFGTLILVAVPLLLLGAVSPWATRLKLANVEEAGSVAGRLYAVSTLGSLVGVFFVSLWAIEAIGTQRTFIVLALVPALAAARGRGLHRPARPAGRARAARPGRPSRPRTGGCSTSPRPSTSTRGWCSSRTARGGWSSTRARPSTRSTSPARSSPTATGTASWCCRSRPAAASRRSGSPRSARRAGRSRGRCCTTTRRPRSTRSTSTPSCSRSATATSACRTRPRLREIAQDARPFLRQSTARYDSIFVDAYRQPYIPFYLTTREFFELVRDRLNPGGSVIVNIGHPNDSPKLEESMTATMGAVFKHVARDPIRSTNSLVIASDVPLSADSIRTAPVPGELRETATASADRFGERLRGGTIFTDDKAPVEWLIDTSIVEYAAGDGG